MMIQLNDWDKKEFINKADFESFLRLLAPFAPHLADELWSQLGHPESVHLAKWPEYDISKSSVSEVKIAVQVDGRVRGTILVSPTDPQEAVQKQALIIPEVAKWLEGKEPKKVIYVAGRIINFLS